MPRAGLSRERVVAAAAEIADALGYDALTLAAIAKRVGVAIPSLYKHVSGLEALRQNLAALSRRDLGEAATRAAVGRSGGDAVRAIARSYRDYARKHPGRYASIVRSPEMNHGESTDALFGIVNAVLAGYGLRGAAAVDAARFVRSSLHGFVQLEGQGGFGHQRELNRSFEKVISSLDLALCNWSGLTSPAARSASG